MLIRDLHISFDDLDNTPLDYMIWLYDRQQQYMIDQQQKKEGRTSIENMLF